MGHGSRGSPDRASHLSGPQRGGSLKGVHAAEFYLEYKRRGGVHSNLVRQDEDHAEVVVASCDGMATVDERADFGDKTQERGAQRRRVGHITELIKERSLRHLRHSARPRETEIQDEDPPVRPEREAARHELDLRPHQRTAENKEHNYTFSSRPRSKQSIQTEGNHRYLHHRFFLSLRRIP